MDLEHVLDFFFPELQLDSMVASHEVDLQRLHFVDLLDDDLLLRIVWPPVVMRLAGNVCLVELPRLVHLFELVDALLDFGLVEAGR